MAEAAELTQGAPGPQRPSSTAVPRLRQRLFLEAEGLFTRFYLAHRALHEGLWLGLLDPADLDAVNVESYRRWSHFADAVYNRQGLHAWEREALAQHFRDRPTILVAAAGGGREMLALAEGGARVDGFDCCAALVESCRGLLKEAGVEAKVWAAAPGKVPEQLAEEAGASYSALIVGWGGYMHIPGRQRRIAFLRALRRRVDDGTPLLLSFFARSARPRYLAAVHRVARVVRALRGSETVEEGDSLRDSFDHYFTEEEIESELRGADFRLRQYVERPQAYAVAEAYSP